MTNDSSSLEFELVPLKEIYKVTPFVKYIFTFDLYWNKTAARIALKYTSDVRIITLLHENRNYKNTGILNIVKRVTGATYSFFMNHLSDLYRSYSSLIDEESKRTFCGYWLGLICYQFGEFVYSNNVQYLLEGFLPKEGDIFIDCGVAGDARNSIIFSSIGCRGYGFEMDKPSFGRAKKISDGKDFSVENFALGSYKTEVNYRSAGEGSRWDINATEVAQVTTLDDYVAENKIPHVDFIKMDTEGAELAILKGAVSTIARFKPKFSLSAYHKLEDLIVLVDFIKSIRPDYEFFLRHHSILSTGLTIYPDLLRSLGLEADARARFELVLYAR